MPCPSPLTALLTTAEGEDASNKRVAPPSSSVVAVAEENGDGYGGVAAAAEENGGSVVGAADAPTDTFKTPSSPSSSFALSSSAAASPIKKSASARRRSNRQSASSRTSSFTSTTTTTSTDDDEDEAWSKPSRPVRPPRRKPRKRRRESIADAAAHQTEADKKASEIEAVLTLGDADERDLLATLAVEVGGLLNDDLRRRVWPKLVRVEDADALALPAQDEVERHAQYNQVILDVARSLKRFPPGIAEEDRPGLQDQLTRLIIRVLLKHPTLHYYQGFHDVAITFLLVVGEELSFHIVAELCRTHFHEFMAPTMERTTYRLHFMYPILELENPSVAAAMDASEVGTIFALSWLITWFGHVLPEYDDVVRLYDFFLAQPPLMPVYLATALVLQRKDEILSCECDMAMMHGLLSRIPPDLRFERLLVDARRLYAIHPPHTVEAAVEARLDKLAVEARLARQERRKRPQAAPSARVTNEGSNLDSWMVGLLVVAAPVVIGVLAWKYFTAEH